MTWTESRMSELGLTSIGIGNDPVHDIESYHKLPDYEKNRGLADAALMKSRYLYHAHNASRSFLVRGDHAKAREWAHTAVKDGETYFFGEWRDLAPSGNSRREPPCREYHDIHDLWVADFDWAMCLAAALGRWDKFELFATYLRDDVRLNVDQNEAHRAWWLYFCGIVRKRPHNEITRFHHTIVESKRAKTDQMLLAWVDALVAGSDEQLSTAMKDYFQHHRRVEARKPGYALAIRASMLLHYGVHFGRNVSRPDNIDLYIVEFAD